MNFELLTKKEQKASLLESGIILKPTLKMLEDIIEHKKDVVVQVIKSKGIKELTLIEVYNKSSIFGFTESGKEVEFRLCNINSIKFS